MSITREELYEKTVPELKAMCRQEKIRGYSKWNEEELVEHLFAHFQELEELEAATAPDSDDIPVPAEQDGDDIPVPAEQPEQPEPVAEAPVEPVQEPVEPAAETDDEPDPAYVIEDTDEVEDDDEPVAELPLEPRPDPELVVPTAPVPSFEDDLNARVKDAIARIREAYFGGIRQIKIEEDDERVIEQVYKKLPHKFMRWVCFGAKPGERLYK